MKLDLSTGCLVTVTQEELDRRVEAFRKMLEQKDAGLCMAAAPIKEGWQGYLTGRSGPGRPSEGAILLGRSGNVTVVNGAALVPRGKAGERNYAMAGGLDGDGFLGYDSCEGFSADKIEEMLGGSKTLAIVNSEYLRADVYEYLKSSLPEVRFIDVTGEAWQIRAVKSREETEILKSGSRMMDKIFAGAGIYINPMKYERDVVTDLRYAAYRLGAGGVDDQISAPTELVSGTDGEPREKNVLLYPGRRIGFGDRVSLKMYSVGNDGYYAGMARTYVLGEPCAETAVLWNTAVEAQDLAASLLKPGARVKDICESVNDMLEQRGFGRDGHSMLHSIGTAVREDPQCFGHYEIPVEENMVFYVGPEVDNGVSLPAACGDMYLVTKDGAKRMTEFPRKLVRLY